MFEILYAFEEKSAINAPKGCVDVECCVSIGYIVCIHPGVEIIIGAPQEK